MSPSDQTESTTAFPITVDYGRSLAEMLTAGRYDFVDPDITAEHFPIAGGGTVQRETYLVHLDRPASDEDVENETEARGLRSATMEELLAFGEAYPDAQREFPVVALDATWQRSETFRSYARLVSYGTSRQLNLWIPTHDWDPFCRFLTIHE